MTGKALGSRRKVLVGIVVSDKMHKTVVVMVERLVRHQAYGKMVLRRVKVKAHDQDNRCEIGDRVLIVETRPLSKDKHWRVMEILEKATA